MQKGALMIPAIILFAVTYVLMLIFGKFRPLIALASGLIFLVTGMLPLAATAHPSAHPPILRASASCATMDMRSKTASSSRSASPLPLPPSSPPIFTSGWSTASRKIRPVPD